MKSHIMSDEIEIAHSSIININSSLLDLITASDMYLHIVYIIYMHMVLYIHNTLYITFSIKIECNVIIIILL